MVSGFRDEASLRGRSSIINSQLNGSMQDIQARLSAYREGKAKQRLKERVIVPNEEDNSHSTQKDDVDVVAPSDSVQHKVEARVEGTSSSKTQEHHQQEGRTEEHSPRSSWHRTALKVLLWVVLWGFFIEIEFGVVYFVVSVLFFLFHSLQGSRRKPSEPSAYSVFNENCEAIDGTLTGEQFERELRLGPSSV